MASRTYENFYSRNTGSHPLVPVYPQPVNQPSPLSAGFAGTGVSYPPPPNAQFGFPLRLPQADADIGHVGFPNLGSSGPLMDPMGEVPLPTFDALPQYLIPSSIPSGYQTFPTPRTAPAPQDLSAALGPRYLAANPPVISRNANVPAPAAGYWGYQSGGSGFGAPPMERVDSSGSHSSREGRKCPPGACDRCRGHKKKCVRSDNNTPCNHCVNVGEEKNCRYTHIDKRRKMPTMPTPTSNGSNDPSASFQ